MNNTEKQEHKIKKRKGRKDARKNGSKKHENEKD